MLISRVEKIIFFLLVFSIPFQTRVLLYPRGGEFAGEWHSAFLYFTDFLFVALLALRPPRFFAKGSVILLGGVLFFTFLSIFSAEETGVAWYRFLKLAEGITLFFYVGSLTSYIKPIAWAFVASGLLQALIADLQFHFQHSLGLWFLRESPVAVGERGVAEILSQGTLMLRAYGTTPNPNVLAAFLGVAIFFAVMFLLWGARHPYTRVGVPGTPTRVFFGGAIFFLTYGLALTFSRGVIIFLLAALLLYFALIFYKRVVPPRVVIRTLGVFLISCIAVGVLLAPELSSRFGFSGDSNISRAAAQQAESPAFQERLFFNKVGVEAIADNPLSGTGMGNFVSYFEKEHLGLGIRLYQPVHNIFILIAAEIGILGAVLFIFFIARILSKNIPALLGRIEISRLTLFSITIFLLLIGLYDHFLLTLQQGVLMFWLILGLLYVKV